MKISKRTVDIISSIKSLNQGLVIKQGNYIKAKKEKGTMPIVIAKVDEEFPRDFAVYNITRISQLLSMMDEPELKFEDQHLMITDKNRSKAKIAYAPERLIDAPDYEMDVELPSVDFEVKVNQQMIKRITQATQQFQGAEVAFIGNGSVITLQTYNTKKSTGEYFSYEVGETDKFFKFVINAEYLNFINDDYTVRASLRGIIEFLSSDGNLQYFMTAHDDSELDG